MRRLIPRFGSGFSVEAVAKWNKWLVLNSKNDCWPSKEKKNYSNRPIQIQGSCTYVLLEVDVWHILGCSTDSWLSTEAWSHHWVAVAWVHLSEWAARLVESLRSCCVAWMIRQTTSCMRKWVWLLLHSLQGMRWSSFRVASILVEEGLVWIIDVLLLSWLCLLVQLHLEVLSSARWHLVQLWVWWLLDKARFTCRTVHWSLSIQVLTQLFLRTVLIGFRLLNEILSEHVLDDDWLHFGVHALSGLGLSLVSFCFILHDGLFIWILIYLK